MPFGDVLTFHSQPGKRSSVDGENDKTRDGNKKMTIKDKFIEKTLGIENIFITYLKTDISYISYFWRFQTKSGCHKHSPDIRFKCRDLNRYWNVDMHIPKMYSCSVFSTASVYLLMAKMAKHMVETEK